jgi:hypothetical protein
MVSGKLYFINGWLKKTKDGQPYLSLSFKPKDDAIAADKSRAEMDDEIAF